MYFRPCDECGANLDPGERCKCRSEATCTRCGSPCEKSADMMVVTLIIPKTMESGANFLCPDCATEFKLFFNPETK